MYNLINNVENLAGDPVNDFSKKPDIRQIRIRRFPKINTGMRNSFLSDIYKIKLTVQYPN